MEDDILTSKEAWEILGVNPMTFSRWVRSRRVHPLPYHPGLKRPQFYQFTRREIMRVKGEIDERARHMEFDTSLRVAETHGEYRTTAAS